MSLPVRRYVLHPGPVFGPQGKAVRHINAARLADLYGVSLRDCIIYPAADTPYGASCRRDWIDPPGAIHLRPDYHGRYDLSDPA